MLKTLKVEIVIDTSKLEDALDKVKELNKEVDKLNSLSVEDRIYKMFGVDKSVLSNARFKDMYEEFLKLHKVNGWNG